MNVQPHRHKTKRAARASRSVLKALESLKDSLPSLREGLGEKGEPRDSRWVPSSSNLRLSEALRQVVSAYVTPDTDLTQARVLALVGGVAWNLRTAPEVGEDERQGLRRHLPPPLAENLERILKELGRRAGEQYPGDRRIIAQTHVHLESTLEFFFQATEVTGY